MPRCGMQTCANESIIFTNGYPMCLVFRRRNFVDGRKASSGRWIGKAKLRDQLDAHGYLFHSCCPPDKKKIYRRRVLVVINQASLATSRMQNQVSLFLSFLVLFLLFLSLFLYYSLLFPLFILSPSLVLFQIFSFLPTTTSACRRKRVAQSKQPMASIDPHQLPVNDGSTV